MHSEIGIRAQVAALLFTTANIGVFTVAVYVVMLVPALHADAGYWLVLTMIVSALLSAPLCWLIAPHVRGKWRKKLVAKPSPLTDSPSRSF